MSGVIFAEGKPSGLRLDVFDVVLTLCFYSKLFL
jgi:hypothetical protein